MVQSERYKIHQGLHCIKNKISIMNKAIVKCLLFAVSFCLTVSVVDAQKKPVRKTTKRATTNKSGAKKSGANVTPSKPDTTAAAPSAVVDSLPIIQVKKSLRSNDAVQRNLITERTPL